MEYSGEIAALGTAIIGAANSIFLTLAGKRIGTQTLNCWRLLFAVSILIFAKMAAMFGTMLGVCMVTSEAPGPLTRSPLGPGSRGTGLLFGIASAVSDSVGLLMSNLGMAGGIEPLSASLVRVGAAAAAIGLVQVVRFRTLNDARRIPDGNTLILIGAVAATGPVLGVIFSLYSVHHAPLGIAATLMSMAPVLLLPASVILFRERFGPKAIAGTLISVLGTCWLFFP